MFTVNIGKPKYLKSYSISICKSFFTFYLCRTDEEKVIKIIHALLLHPDREWHDEFEQSYTSHGVPWVVGKICLEQFCCPP